MLRKAVFKIWNRWLGRPLWFKVIDILFDLVILVGIVYLITYVI